MEMLPSIPVDIRSGDLHCKAGPWSEVPYPNPKVIEPLVAVRESHSTSPSAFRGNPHTTPQFMPR